MSLIMEIKQEDVQPGGKYHHLYTKCTPGSSLHLRSNKKKKSKPKNLYKNKKFKPSQKPINLDSVHKIEQQNRLKFLIKACKSGKNIDKTILIGLRECFEKIKQKLFPLDNELCYICKHNATMRHHVIPLSRGGKNIKDNIVGLCEPCHMNVHPWMKFIIEPKL